jgi:hypothetical protein
MPVFQCLSQFLKRCRNIFGSTCHGPHAIFKKHSIVHNNGIYIGFIKISECCMAGELIGLLRLLRLRNILRATIALKQFKEIWEKHFRERSLFSRTRSFGSIYLHCVVFSMHQCVSFDWLTRKFLQWTSFIIMFVEWISYLLSMARLQRATVVIFLRWINPWRI